MNESDHKLWKAQKAKLKKEFAYLTEEDLHFEEGKKELMMERLQIILGKTKGDLIKFMEID